ncbi:hypothetical protein [Microbacterium sp.]|uniref:hypothetical protein n=1 Tax=Microbacterium sp. TaxID=51671 RepID=UPI0039E27E96
MKTPDPLLSPDRVLATDDDLADLLSRLLGSAHLRQCWLIMLGPDDRSTGPLMPMSDYPRDPDELARSGDLGTLPVARLLTHRFGQFAELCGATQIVLVWERRGSRTFRDEDRRWAGAISRHCRELGVPLRAQFVLHSRGLRVIAPDDQC